jgi:hypothetical protein
MGALMNATPAPTITGGFALGPTKRRPALTLLRAKQLEEDELLMRFITDFVESGRIEK